MPFMDFLSPFLALFGIFVFLSLIPKMGEWAKNLKSRRSKKALKKKHWSEHPRYIADPSALFGAPPRLQCVSCDGIFYELYFGHCFKCANKEDIPRSGLDAQDFHDQMGKGLPAVSSTFKEKDPDSEGKVSMSRESGGLTLSNEEGRLSRE